MDSSPLTKLSAELRNRIFEYVLSHEHAVEISGPRLKNPLALAQACKQLNSECSRMYYGMNDFIMGLNNTRETERTDKWNIFLEWWNSLQPDRRAYIQKIIVEIGCDRFILPAPNVETIVALVEKVARTLESAGHCKLLVRMSCPTVDDERHRHDGSKYFQGVDLDGMNLAGSLPAAIEAVRDVMASEPGQREYLNQFWIKKQLLGMQKYLECR